jgi:hypothetical protein
MLKFNADHVPVISGIRFVGPVVFACIDASRSECFYFNGAPLIFGNYFKFLHASDQTFST